MTDESCLIFINVDSSGITFLLPYHIDLYPYQADFCVLDISI